LPTTTYRADAWRITGCAIPPGPLKDRVDHYWHAYQQAAHEQGVAAVSHRELVALLSRVWGYSDFAAQLCIGQPGMLADLQGSGDLFRSYRPQEWRARAVAALEPASGERELGAALRRLRQREMLRIACRDLGGWAPLPETTADLSYLADACVEAALARLYAWQAADFGTPRGERSGKAQGLVVLGMGKLGAYELNFSSDIDLIFAYPEEGDTEGGRRSVGNDQFFNQLGQRLIAALDAQTELGLVFRVDMRLRPYGDAGPLVMSFDAMEEYYQTHGRDWERYAMIKARQVAGDFTAGAELLSLLRPFVYRRYLDFGAFAALRDMKQLIREQVARKGMERNVKLGPGGIREVEFVGQVFQLIRGGRELDLQERAILPVLQRLAEKRYLPGYAAQELRSAYVFLRHTEHRIQAMFDEQSQELPQEPLAQMRLALAMGFAAWEPFVAALYQHMATVHGHFEQVFAAPQAQQDSVKGSEPARLWLGALSPEQAQGCLRALGYPDSEAALVRLSGLREGSSYRLMTRQGRERLDQLMPMLIEAVGRGSDTMATLERVLHVIDAIGRRTSYYSLLVEHPMALSQLVKLCAASSWISGHVARHPLLLDELLDPRSLYAPLTAEDLQAELSRDMASVAEDDLEQQMEVLRQFAHSNMLRVAAADVTNVLPLMRVSDHLTAIAEVVLREVLGRVWQHLTARHGRPRCTVADARREAGFAVIAYGKLGGIELGYGSDLDLVFLHNSDGEEEQTDGPRVLDNAVFFGRLAQRIIHMLNTQTPSGVLYEIDVRLRPSGAAGLLVSSLRRFADYQRSEAWTWEHQALVRARVVAGDPQIAAAFARVRAEVLGRVREPDALKREVREMRQKMRDELGSRDPATFDIKQDPGGIADIEFLVQYGVLRWAHRHPQLLQWPDNIRLLATLAELQLFATADAQALTDAYRELRAVVHRLSLQELPAKVEASSLATTRERVQRIWAALIESPDPQ
jgi:glutamate-ammonia-ligase adenylyltransferase